MQITTPRTRLVAVLGPTNTGKTYLALERMLAHGSGMIGFPLRLLARENYDRALKLKRPGQVALITGEERIVPAYARYFFCTVESMPLDRCVDFLAVDEIQMCADGDRGHVFTDRLLHARGAQETMFLGAETIRPLLSRLTPEAEFVTRPRFSTLAHAGAKKIVRLAPRSAVVAFSAVDVYTIAELIRRHRGGAAIVMGALSPRTRNAQVGLFQSGEVDYLVATDAIGMGLNLDLDHVVFAGLGKFDGAQLRRLRPEELAQIAGRAGRHMRDGTFGTTMDAPELAPDVVERIENHRFDPLEHLFWRNTELDFSSLQGLTRSLSERPEGRGLIRVREADDERALARLARDPEIAALAKTADGVRLLWEVCRIPDFRKTTSDFHIRLLGRIFRGLRQAGGRLDTDWIATQVASLDRVDGDIDTLTDRIAAIRIWTYIAHRASWLADPDHWRELSRAVEDRLSDALHERLAQRFVDARTTHLVRRLKAREQLHAQVSAEGEVSVEGHFIGHLEGFRFIADETQGKTAGRAVTSAALRALSGEIARRADALAAAGDPEFTLGDDGRLAWRGWDLARLTRGAHILKPRIRLLHTDLLAGTMRDRMTHRLAAWLEQHLEGCLAPIFRARAQPLEGAARGIVYQLAENLGPLTRRRAARQLAALESDDHAKLRRLGVRLGRRVIYLPGLIKPGPARLAALLWAIHAGMEELPPLPPAGRVSAPLPGDVPEGYLEAAGYLALGTLAVRVDIVERLLGKLRSVSAAGGNVIGADLLNLAGCTRAEMATLLVALDYQTRETENGLTFAPPRPAKRKRGRKPGGGGAEKTASPFAKLKDIALPT